MIRIETPADIGETLALLRQLAGLTQQQLVAACGISQTEISLYELGDRVPRPAKLLRHLAGLGWGLAVVPLGETCTETALSATESAERGPGVDGEGVSGSNGCTGHTEAVTLLRQALHLRTHGERAPGGTETWADWDRRAETLLRGVVLVDDGSWTWRFWGEHPAHPTCIDVTGTDQTPRSEWACGPECPKEA